MADTNADPVPGPGRPARFDTTHWSVVLAACDPESPGAREALQALCSASWYPIYAFIRRRGHDPDEAADLTQAFFTRLLEKDFLAGVDPVRGRFRSFLMAACGHFLSNERDRQCARKRGGGRPAQGIDGGSAELRYAREPSHDLTPERLFQRRWALGLLDGALERLEREYHSLGKAGLYDHLKSILVVGRGSAPYTRVADGLGMSEPAVKKAAERLRARYRAILREQIAGSLEDAGRVDEEIRDLFAILAS